MTQSELIIILSINFILLNLFIYLSIKQAQKYNLLDSPNSRSLHNKKIPNIGGLPVVSVFFVNIFLFKNYNYTINQSRCEL